MASWPGLTVFEGGPLDGKLAQTYGRRPVILLGEVQEATLLDYPQGRAYWNERCGWYERNGVEYWGDWEWEGGADPPRVQDRGRDG